MEPEKTYSLKKSLLVSFAVALALTCATYFLSFTLGRFQSILLPDSGASWYYWKLPHPELWASITMWVFYLAHQVAVGERGIQRCTGIIFGVECDHRDTTRAQVVEAEILDAGVALVLETRQRVDAHRDAEHHEAVRREVHGGLPGRRRHAAVAHVLPGRLLSHRRRVATALVPADQ